MKLWTTDGQKDRSASCWFNCFWAKHDHC